MKVAQNKIKANSVKIRPIVEEAAGFVNGIMGAFVAKEVQA